MAELKVQPLNGNEPVVDPATGRPTMYFLQRLLDRGLLTNQTLEDIEFLQAVQVLGGIGIDGGGALGDGDITLDANVQEILDEITTTRGSVLYRGAAGWAALAPGTNNYVLTSNGPGADPAWEAAASSGGTVTSVAITVPTGFTRTGSPITTSGTIAISFAAGYSLPTTAKQAQWDTAYGWGDHAVAGYLDAADIGVTVQAYDLQLAHLAALSYAGNALKVVRVNAAANAFELADAPSVLEIDCGTAANSGTPYITIDGGDA